MTIDVGGIKLLGRLRSRVGAWKRDWQLARRVRRSPDRAVLQGPLFTGLRDEGLLSVGSRILWIGCARYTTHYYRALEDEGAFCFTIEIDPEKERFGRYGQHTVGSMLDLDSHYPDFKFKLILCNGVLGWGVNSVEEQRRAFDVMAKILEPGGALILGWNTDTMPDPIESRIYQPHFFQSSIAKFPERYAVQNTTHVYDCFRRASLK